MNAVEAPVVETPRSSRPARPAGDDAALRPATRRMEATEEGAELACATCLGLVTTAAARIEVAGAHEHTFANPHGFCFRIGCFAEAPGCVAVGGPSTYWSWFSGYRWEVGHCARCGEHLGWQFRSDTLRFHGLILDRLVEIDRDARRS